MRGFRGLGAAEAEPAAPPDNPGQTYTYGPGTQVVPANATLPLVQMNIVNHDFEADFLVATSTGSFKCLVQVCNKSGNRFLSSAPMTNGNHFGTGENPLPMLSPLQLEKNSYVIFTLTDTSGAQNTIDIGFIGRELT